MTNGLPEKFAEDWGKVKADISHIKGKVDESATDIKELPCKSKDYNPITEIAKLKSAFGFIKWICGIILAGAVSLIVYLLRKPFEGG